MSAKIIGKYILKGNIALLSPLIIGSGDDKELDIEIVKDANGKPYIPATSFVGALRHFIFENYKTNLEWNTLFWGDINMSHSEMPNSRQSNAIFDDLTLENNNFTIGFRDGIKIDYDTGITKDTGKFDFEILEPGAMFNLFIEVNVWDNDNIDIIQKNIKAIQESLSNPSFRLGASTTRGYGKIQVNSAIYFFDFSKSNNVEAWLTFLEEKKIQSNPVQIQTDIELVSKMCSISGEFILKDSIIVGSPSADPQKPDSSMLNLGNNYVIPGSSLKGPIRSRAEKILKTLNIYNEQKVRNLFGFEGEKKENKSDVPALKSKITIDEAIIPKNTVAEKIISRIRIDRFSGGTIDGALFDALPIFAKEEDTKINIKATIKNPEDWEVGLLLLVFKDIWTGDLAFGGDKTIGRGTFKGNKLAFSYDNKSIELKDVNNLSDNDKQYLNSFVQKLSQQGENNE